MQAIFRLSLFAIALLSTVSLSGWSLPGGCDPFEGTYVGAALGVGTNMVSQRSNSSALFIAQLAPSDILELASRGDVYSIRPWGEIYAGWGLHFFNWLYLGGRFGINFSSFRVHGPSSQASAQVTEPAIPLITFTAGMKDEMETKTWAVEYTLDFKPGILWSDQTMLFGIIGAAFNRATLNGTSQFNYVNGLAPIVSTGSRLQVRGREASVGVRGGVGIEQMLTYCISLSISYVYTSYWPLEARGEGDTQTQLGVTTNGHTTRFRSRARRQVTSIGLSYYF